MDGFYTGQLVYAPISTGDPFDNHLAPGVALGTTTGDLPGSETVWVRFAGPTRHRVAADTDPVPYRLPQVLPAEVTASRPMPPWRLGPGDVIRLADGTTRMVREVIERGVMADRTYVVRLEGGGHCEVAPGVAWIVQVLTWALPRVPSPGREHAPAASTA